MADSSDSDSSSSSASSPSDNLPSPKANPQPTKDKDKETSPASSRTSNLETQQKERAEAAKKQAEAKRQQDAQHLEEAKRLEEEEAQARRRAFVEPAPPQTGYSCADCNGEVLLGRGEPVRCKKCGCRILYKKRTDRLVQFKAD